MVVAAKILDYSLRRRDNRRAEVLDGLPIAEGISRRYMRLLVLGALNWTQTWFDPGGDSPAQIARVFLNMLKPLGNKLES